MQVPPRWAGVVRRTGELLVYAGIALSLAAFVAGAGATAWYLGAL